MIASPRVIKFGARPLPPPLRVTTDPIRQTRLFSVTWFGCMANSTLSVRYLEYATPTNRSSKTNRPLPRQLLSASATPQAFETHNVFYQTNPFSRPTVTSQRTYTPETNPKRRPSGALTLSSDFTDP